MLPVTERLLVIVPAWNEQITLPQVIAELRATLPDADILVVSDGSTDRTVQVGRAAGAMVLELPLNLGVGGAMRAGYKYALRHGYQVTVQVDADGQHDPRDVPRLRAALDEEQADVVIGARFAGTGTYRARGPRWWSMKFLSAVLSRVTGTRLTDTTSGFKMCGHRAIRLFATNYPAEYLGDTVEALVIASRAGLKVRQIGVGMRERAGGTPSHSPFKAGVFLLRAFLALVIALSRPNEPLESEVPA
ncbi:glycosyltransferase family 2 protein [Oerskovia sp. KBS0722]|uniref:glycosyltransferase family 2 protein n=1 Tax=Oerskovia sp. KBS0722 TaxID=1179673 RepID=UPI00110E1CFC|nr:glycosyltransferase family 2 protein [Oerskovia sp. KBS0722]QDW64159.1 glycosyltransferase family 2 protein [Oerskovia sp. KBS0722]